MKLILQRGYSGWTDNAFVVAGTKIWIPKKFCLNWIEDKPPQKVECDLPKWFLKKYPELWK